MSLFLFDGLGMTIILPLLSDVLLQCPPPDGERSVTLGEARSSIIYFLLFSRRRMAAESPDSPRRPNTFQGGWFDGMIVVHGNKRNPPQDINSICYSYCPYDACDLLLRCPTLAFHFRFL